MPGGASSDEDEGKELCTYYRSKYKTTVMSQSVPSSEGCILEVLFFMAVPHKKWKVCSGHELEEIDRSEIKICYFSTFVDLLFHLGLAFWIFESTKEVILVDGELAERI